MGCHIVLGLGFGDEGKGITTDYLCSKLSDPIVVRFSGGHQAGHTVKINDKKHVHSSFGSGTLRGVPSYFAEETCFYLPNLAKEYKALKNIGLTPDLTIHPFAMMTTPYDVAWNRVMHSKNNHGSVGLGIGSTMSRHQKSGYKLYAYDLNHTGILGEKLTNIKREFERQARQISTSVLVEFIEAVRVEEEEFEYIVEEWRDYFSIQDFTKLQKYKNIIFEGSQGIMLDMDHGIFPNVTYAYTTSRNALNILQTIGRSLTSVFYVTRCYQTRHGNGWMSNTKELNLINNEGEINTPNKYQGTMRFGEIDYKLLNHALGIDELYLPDTFTRHLMVTCVDQRPNFKIDREFAAKFERVFKSTSPESEMITECDESDLTEKPTSSQAVLEN